MIYEETRGVLKSFLESVIRDAVTYTEHAKRKTVTSLDVKLIFPILWALLTISRSSTLSRDKDALSTVSEVKRLILTKFSTNGPCLSSLWHTISTFMDSRSRREGSLWQITKAQWHVSQDTNNFGWCTCSTVGMSSVDRASNESSIDQLHLYSSDNCSAYLD